MSPQDKKGFGYVLMALPFVFFIAYDVFRYGWLETLIVLVTSIGIMGLFLFGSVLVRQAEHEEKKQRVNKAANTLTERWKKMGLLK